MGPCTMQLFVICPFCQVVFDRQEDFNQPIKLVIDRTERYAHQTCSIKAVSIPRQFRAEVITRVNGEIVR